MTIKAPWQTGIIIMLAFVLLSELLFLLNPFLRTEYGVPADFLQLVLWPLPFATAYIIVSRTANNALLVGLKLYLLLAITGLFGHLLIAQAFTSGALKLYLLIGAFTLIPGTLFGLFRRMQLRRQPGA